MKARGDERPIMVVMVCAKPHHKRELVIHSESVLPIYAKRYVLTFKAVASVTPIGCLIINVPLAAQAGMEFMSAAIIPISYGVEVIAVLRAIIKSVSEKGVLVVICVSDREAEKTKPFFIHVSTRSVSIRTP